MEFVAQILGILAVILFLLSFQFKKRGNIIAVNLLSRVFYICQYLLLGAFEGAVLDLSGALSSLLAKHKRKKCVARFGKAVPILATVAVTAVGLAFYKNIYSLFAVIGIILETVALWMSKEKSIRVISFAAAPFWMIYNLANTAYGSAIGNVLAMISIVSALVRYRKSADENNGNN